MAIRGMGLIAGLGLIAVCIMGILGIIIILLGLMKSFKHGTVKGQGSIAILFGISGIVIAIFSYYLEFRYWI